MIEARTHRGSWLDAGRAAFVCAMLACLAPSSFASTSTDDFPTDRLIVRLAGGAPALSKSAADREAIATRLSAQTGELMRPLRVMGDGAQVMSLFRRLSAADVRALASRIAHDPEILEILPDRIFFPALDATDPSYASQWYLTQTSGINAPAAWDITTGSVNLVIGIIDTGKLPHEELVNRWIGGYDFVTLPRGNDSDGRDADASDPGDWVTSAESTAVGGDFYGCPVTDSRWHGTLMAGVIGAQANNALGIAGVNWSSRLLPVRVVGKCGGYESDIADGMRWAMGIAISGVPANPDIADLLNVSLSAPGACSSALQSAINEVIAAGAPIVVAAGNNSVDAAGYSPGNCANVIAVGAVDRNGGKAGYTNFGTALALSAPGGKSLEHFTVGDTADNQWVLTTSNQGTTDPSGNNAYYDPVFGTSIAAAQVTGIASLMLSTNPTLSPQFVREILRNTARTFPTNTTAIGSQADCTTSLCGSGIANAAGALPAAAQWGTALPMLAAGASFVHGLASDGSVVAWGENGSSGGASGQLGNGTTVSQATPIALASPSGIVRLSVGSSANHTLAVRADGSVWAWGSNSDGQLGDGTNVLRPSPVQVAGLAGVTRAARGQYHSMAMKGDGTVWTWGRNSSLQLGDGTATPRMLPGQVLGVGNAIDVAASGTGSFVLRSDASVWGWGGLVGGNGLPAAVSGLTSITAIAAALNHLLALRADGTVLALGDNTYGELGNGTTTYASTPVPVSGLTNVVAIAAGEFFSIALKGDGTVWAWGRNDAGQVGDGTTVALRTTPLRVPGITGVAAIAAGRLNGYALKPDGSLWTWGSAAGGALGGGATSGFATLPIQVPGIGGAGLLNLGPADPSSFAPQTDVAFASVRISNAIRISGIANGAAVNAAGGEFSIGCSGTFAASGTINDNDRVCVRHTSSAACDTTTATTLTIAGSPTRTFNATTITCDATPDALQFAPQGSVALGATITSDTVTIGGINTAAAIGVSNGEYSIGCNGTFTSVSGTIANGQTVCVRQVGAETYDTLTTATLTIGASSIPFHVMTLVAPAFSATPAVTGGALFAHALRNDGALFGWGLGDTGVMGNGSLAQFNQVPVALAGLSGVTRLGAGPSASGHAAALRSDGRVWVWGANEHGQLGDGSGVTRALPILLEGLSGVVRVARGQWHSLALKADGTVWAWGWNGSGGQLGYAGGGLSLTPVSVAGIGSVIEVAASAHTSFALKGDGSVWGWGNSLGASPVALAGFAQITMIAGGGGHLLGLRTDGTVWSWGWNAFGQLGNGTTTDSFVSAVQVSGLSSVVAVAASADNSVALKSDGTVWGWGRNSSGEVGDGSVVQRLTPVQVVGLSGVSAIGAGASNTYAIKPDGSVWAWGSVGAIGFPPAPGTGIYKTPMQVAGVGGSGFLNLGASNSAFAPQTDVPISSERTSNTIVVTGIGNGSVIGVSGGSYSIGCTATFTTSAGTINNNDVVCVRQTSAPTCGTTTTTTLAITGLAPQLFSVTTVACDSAPDPFAFVPQAHVAPGYVATSNTVSIAGINTPVPIAIAGGEYSIGCTGTFTAASGTIANGQTVCVRQTASNVNDALATATLTAGGASEAFHVMTLAGPSFAAPPMVAGGDGFTHLLRSDGTVYALGTAYTGVAVQATTPVPLATLSGVTRLSAGPQAHHTLALRADGSVWAWGQNDSGKLGDGTDRFAWNPVKVVGLSGVTRIARGGSHSLAVKDGNVWAWGDNSGNQLGDGTLGSRMVPGPVPGLSGITDVAANVYSSFARGSDGAVWGWGLSIAASPTAFAALAGATAIAGGDSHLLVLKSDGTVWARGENNYGELGNGTNASSYFGQQVQNLSGVVAIAAGSRFSLALKSDGTVWAWGRNDFGQLGDGTTGHRLTPVQVVGLTGITSIGTGYYVGYAWRPDGKVRSWGNGYSGAIGNGSLFGTYVVPVQVLGQNGDGVLALELANSVPAPFAFEPAFNAAASVLVPSNAIVVSGLGSGVSSSITASGGEYAINGGAFTTLPGTVVNGNSVVMRVGSAPAYSTTTFATLAIGGPSGQSANFYVRTRTDPSANRVVPQVAAGDSHTYLLTSDGTVFAAGYNGNGQLGNGTTLGLSTLRPVSGLSGVVAIASGAFHGLALRSGGSVVAWGSNSVGQLGHNSTNTSERYFVDVSSLSDVAAISGGRYHSVALKGEGTVWSWGLNSEGQAGDSTYDLTKPYPVQVTGLAGVTAIAAGGRHTLALLAGGTVVAWGANESGQLGNGGTAQSHVPVAVSGLSGVIALAAGDAHSLALKNDGTVVAWGFNAFGQLGDGSTTNRLAPVAVSSLGAGVGLIAAGANHSLAVKAGGALYSWGNNANSQLGNGNNLNQSTPVLLATPTAVVAISGGARHNAVTTSARKLYVWGDNFFGQVGNRSGNYSPHSASLNVLRGDSVISTGGGPSGGEVTPGSQAGSSILEIDGRQTDYPFGSIDQSADASVQGRYKNASATENITGISIAVTGAGFTLPANGCPATLAPDQDCGFTIAFAPGASGTFAGVLEVTSSVVYSPERLALSGTGLPPATPAISFAATGLDFPPQTVGAPTSPALYTVTNTGNANLSIASIASTLADFTPGHNCTNIAPGVSCAISVTFTPAAAGGRTAYLTVNSNASGTPHSVTVYGTGVATLSPYYTLTVNKSGTGTGTVISTNPAVGIDCGGDCSEPYSEGTAVTLGAAANSGSAFAGWSGGGCSGSGGCTVTMNSAVTVTATFNLAGVVRSEFNGDGRSDVLWRDATNGFVYQWQMNELAISSQGYLPTVPTNWAIAGIGDVSGDGRADVLWREATGLNYLWTMNGLAIASQGYLPTVPNPWIVVGMGDASGDGRADVFWRNPATGDNYLWIVDGLSITGQGYLPNVPGPDWEIVGIADYSGDARADVLWRNKISGANYLWVMNGLTISNQGYLPTVTPVDWEIVGAPDANGDGRADVLWRHKVNGQMYLWLMNGFTIASQGYLPSVADANWKVVGYGDYNGDGKSDVLWRNATSGLNYLWTLNGISVVTQGYLPSVAGANWQPVKR